MEGACAFSQTQDIDINIYILDIKENKEREIKYLLQVPFLLCVQPFPTVFQCGHTQDSQSGSFYCDGTQPHQVKKDRSYVLTAGTTSRRAGGQEACPLSRICCTCCCQLLSLDSPISPHHHLTKPHLSPKR